MKCRNWNKMRLCGTCKLDPGKNWEGTKSQCDFRLNDLLTFAKIFLIKILITGRTSETTKYVTINTTRISYT